MTDLGFDLTITEPTDVDSWTPIILTDLPEQPPIQPTLGQVGFVYPATRHVFSGPQESAKTLAAYAVALQVVRHNGGPVLLIDFEMGSYNARNRLRELGATSPELAQIPYIEPHEPATEQRITTLVQLHPNLVIIDAAAGAYDLQGLDDNKRQDVGKISRLYVDRFWKAGIATIFLDHVVKNSETRGKYAIGSERKVGGTEVHLGFEVITPISRGTNGLYKITTHKDRGGYLKRGTLAEMSLHSDPQTHRITWEFKAAALADEEHPWMPTKVMEKISGLLEQQTVPITRNAITNEIGGRKEVAYKAIDNLVRLQYATETPGPNRSKLLQTTRPFTVHEWENQPKTPVLPGTPRWFPEPPESVVPGGPQVVPGTSVTPVVPSPHRGEVPGTTGGERNHNEIGNHPNDESTPVVPDWSWIDELTPREDPPEDLHDPPATPDDDLPI